jgi:uncharacterized Tic20 family protein
MAEEQKLEQQFAEYQKIAEEHKDVDVASLMLRALQNENQNVVSAKSRRWAYLISIGVPPLGLLFALNYYFSDKDDGKQVAYWCIGLTVLSIVIFLLFAQGLFSSAGVTPAQIEQIKPADVQQLLQ